MKRSIEEVMNKISEEGREELGKIDDIKARIIRKTKNHKYDIGIEESRKTLYSFFLEERIKKMSEILKNYDKKKLSESQKKYFKTLSNIQILEETEKKITPSFKELFPLSLEFLITNNETEDATMFIADRVRSLPKKKMKDSCLTVTDSIIYTQMQY